MKKPLILILAICLWMTPAYSQTDSCGNNAIEQAVRQKDSFRYDAFQQNFRNTVTLFRTKHSGNFALPNPPPPDTCSNCLIAGIACPLTKYVIPVVVHVVHSGGTDNISDAQIEHQIALLNKHFSNASAAGSHAVNTGIQFILASKDINNTTITGITRHNSPLCHHRKIAETDTLMSLGIQNLPMANYLHIWIVNEILDASGNNTGVKAYATRPGSNFGGNEGIVCTFDWLGDYSIFGNPVHSASTGNTLTHEIGHYMGLWHPFDNGGCTGLHASDCHLLGDMCCDVPAVGNQNQNCGYYNTCTETYGSNPPDQKENFMDYTVPSCKNTFTENQTSIMHATLQTFRAALWQPPHINNQSSDHCILAARFSGNKNFMCTGISENTLFTAYAFAGATYQWKVWRNDTLTSTTSTSHTLTIGNSLAGDYTIALLVTVGSTTVSDTLVHALAVSNCGSKLASDRTNWYFGQWAGLGFYNGGFANRDLGPYSEMDQNHPHISTEEGSLALSDLATGDLLFYGAAAMFSERFEVYGAAYTLLKGQLPVPVIANSGAVQAGVAFPAPGLANEYILFTPTTGRTNNHNITGFSQSGYVYSFITIDTANRANDSVSFRKNLNIRDSSGVLIDAGEGIAAARHCNGTDFWVLCKGREDTLYRLLVSTGRQVLYMGFYLCGETSIQTPVVFSPNGKFLNIGRYLYTFNRANGNISLLHFDSTLADQLNSHGVYGAAFSNNSKVLYRSYIHVTPTFPYFTPVFQYDLESSDALLSRKNINPDNWDVRSLQNTPDGRIFLSATGMPFVSEIEAPDNLNTPAANNCGYNEIALSLSENGIGGYSNLDLPNFPISAVADQEPLDFLAIISNCSRVHFISNRACAVPHRWFFGDGDSSTSDNPIHTYAQQGTYSVTLIVAGDTFAQNVTVQLPHDEYKISGDSTSCNLEQVFLYTTKPNTDMLYHWHCDSCEASSALQNTFEVTLSGDAVIRLQITDNKTGCLFSDSLVVTRLPAITNNFIQTQDSFVCLPSEFSIDGSSPQGGAGNFSFKWFKSINGSTNWDSISGVYTASYSQPDTGIFYFRLTTSGKCAQSSNITNPIQPLFSNNTISVAQQPCRTGKSFSLSGSWPVAKQPHPFQPTYLAAWESSTDSIYWSASDSYSNITDSALVVSHTANYPYNTPAWFRRRLFYNGCYHYSNPVKVTPRFHIYQQPADWYTCVPLGPPGSDYHARFFVGLHKADTSDPVEFHWQIFKNGAWSGMGSSQHDDYSSYSDSIFVANVTNFYAINSATYPVRCVMYTSCDTFTTDSVYTPKLYIANTASNPLSFTAQPQDVIQSYSAPGMMSATANISGSNYQWFRLSDSATHWKWQYKLNSLSTIVIDEKNDICEYYTKPRYKVRIGNGCNSLDSRTAIVYPPATEIFIRDIVGDEGNEPDQALANLSYTHSPDIWITHSIDSTNQPYSHYTLPNMPRLDVNPNIIWTRINNRSPDTSKQAILYLYWTLASTEERWPLHWTNNPSNQITNHYGQNFPKGSLIDSLTIPPIPPNSHIQIPYQWDTSFMPKPWWYTYKRRIAGVDSIWSLNHLGLCFLARIQYCNPYPHGMTWPEKSDLAYNVKNNNKIATANTILGYINPPAFLLPQNPLFVYVGNGHDTARNIDITFFPDDWAYFNYGEVVVELSRELLDIWTAAGSQGSGFSVIDSSILLVSNPLEFKLQGLTFQPHTFASLGFEFYEKSVHLGNANKLYTFELLQQTSGDSITDGHIQFMLQGPIFLSGGGGDKTSNPNNNPYNTPNQTTPKRKDSHLLVFPTPEQNIPSTANIYPNPFANRLFIDLSLAHAAPVQILLTDIHGRNIYQSSQNLPQGKNNITIPTANLSQGIYYVHITIGNSTHIAKIILNR